MRNIIPSFALSRVPYKKLPSLVLYVFTLPSFSSILCPLLSPSIHVKQYLFSIIHLSFLILFCVFPILIYLFFFFIQYFSVISLYLDKLTRIWLFLRWPWAFGLWSSTAIVDLFSTFISGCMIGDPYQLGWILSTTSRFLSWWMLSCLWWLSYMYARFLISPAACSLILSLDLPSEKRLKIGWSHEQSWSRPKQNQTRQKQEQCGGKRCNKCNLHPSNYSSTESGNTKEVYLCFIDNTEA